MADDDGAPQDSGPPTEAGTSGAGGADGSSPTPPGPPDGPPGPLGPPGSGQGWGRYVPVGLPARWGRPAFRDAVRLYLRTPLPFLAVGLVSALLGIISAFFADDIVVVGAFSFVATMVGGVLNGVIVALANAALGGGRPSLRDALASAGRRVLPLLGYGALIALPGVGYLAAGHLLTPPPSAGFVTMTSDEAGRLLALSGLILVASVVLLWVMLRLSLAPAAIVIDRLPLRAALRESWRQSGKRLRAVLWFALAPWALVLPLWLGALAFEMPGATGTASSSTLSALPANIVVAFVAAVVTPAALIAGAILYRRLRIGNPDALPVPPLAPSVRRAALTVLGAGWILGTGLFLVALGRVANLAVGDALARLGTVDLLDQAPTASSCAIPAPVTSARSGASLWWVAWTDEPIPANSDVELVILRDGATVRQGRLQVDAAGQSCIYASEPVGTLPPGAYRIELHVDSAYMAGGSFTITP